MVPRDLLWKSIIEDLFEPCIRFFYPVESQLVDWSRPPEFLDKELARLAPKSSAKGRVVDKLVKIWLKDGTERWMLIHIEVQGYSDPNFAFRMYQYRVRIRERYGVKVVALAILTDDDPHFRPSEYLETVWDNMTLYRYRMFKVLENPPSSFADPDNLFSDIMETAYYGVRQNKLGDEGLLELKKNLIRKLLKKGFERQRVLNVLHFIDEYVHFAKPEFQTTFEAEIDKQLKIQPTMSTYELVLKARRAEARKLRKEAKTEGRAEGRAETIESAAERMLRKGLTPELVVDVLQMELAQVIAIVEKIKSQN